MSLSTKDTAAIDAILDYWIGDADTTPGGIKAKSKRWYGGGKALDEEIRTRFGTLLTDAENGVLNHWQATARGSLALIILFDQFSRNIYRGTAMAFGNDERAVVVADHALAQNQHLSLGVVGCSFLLHPYHHAESEALQDLCVEGYEALMTRSDDLWHDQIQSHLKYAVEHRDVVKRFGRFPHRNAVLDRASTSEELQYLEDAPRYGQ
ncbi:MAG: DUF924 family protein [Pseudomonadota bacterium]